MIGPFDVVVLSSDLQDRRHLEHILVEQGEDPLCLSTLRECYEVLTTKKVGLVFCDPRLSDGSCYDLLSTFRPTDKKPRVVVTSRSADWEEFKEAIHWGAFDVIASPCRPTDVEWMLIQARRDERRAEGPGLLPAKRTEFAKVAGL